MNYEEMSESKLNRKVAYLRFGKDSIIRFNPKSRSSVIVYGHGEFDPCNNPSDTWPIIFDNKIAIAPAKATAGMWFGSSDHPVTYAPMDSNPLRAAMIVFLMMNEGES